MDDAHIFETRDIVLDLVLYASEPELKYYYHGTMSRAKTGLTIDEVVEYFENDLSVIVIDPYEKKLYRAGKPMKIEHNTKNAKKIEFKALK